MIDNFQPFSCTECGNKVVLSTGIRRTREIQKKKKKKQVIAACKNLDLKELKNSKKIYYNKSQQNFHIYTGKWKKCEESIFKILEKRLVAICNDATLQLYLYQFANFSK